MHYQGASKKSDTQDKDMELYCSLELELVLQELSVLMTQSDKKAIRLKWGFTGRQEQNSSIEWLWRDERNESSYLTNLLNSVHSIKGF